MIEGAVVATETLSPRAPLAYDGWLDRRWQRLGRLVIAMWLGVLVAASLVGERESNIGDLTTALADGSTSHVEIVGLPRRSNWTGSSLVSVRWQGQYVDRVTDIWVTQGEGSRSSRPPDGQVEFRGDLLEWLKVANPELTVSYAEWSSSSYVEGFGWRSPGWVGVAALAAFLSTLLLTSGPRTWRATSWAWVWLVLLGGWIGVAAFLLLGGPVGVGRPREGHRRLTGGWAFLIAVLFLAGPNRP